MEIGDSGHTLVQDMKCVYANEKGVQVFTLCGVGDGTQAIPLYAVGGKSGSKAQQTDVGERGKTWLGMRRNNF